MTLDTKDREYTERLVELSDVWWKKLGPQALYGWNLRRLKPGFTLDIGCGIGRNLKHLRGKGVGIDHNRFSVEHARSLGLTAFTTDEFKATEYNRPGRFNSLLLSHVAEHMPYGEYLALLREYLPVVRPGGRVLVFCPQEAGFRSDATHIEFTDFDRLRAAANETGLRIEREYSFPLPRAFGKTFVYNEFVSVARKPRDTNTKPEDQ
jgi:SAM-dependent methyltransferase